MSDDSLTYVSLPAGDVLSTVQASDEKTLEVLKVVVVKHKTKWKVGREPELRLEKEKLCFAFKIKPEDYDPREYGDKYDNKDSSKIISISKKKLQTLLKHINEFRGKYNDFGLEEKLTTRNKDEIASILEFMKKQKWYPGKKLATKDLMQEFSYPDNEKYKDVVDFFFHTNKEKHGFGIACLIKRVNQTSGALIDSKTMNLNVAELDAFNEWLWGSKFDGSNGNLYK